jgi:hypothetical protein
MIKNVQMQLHFLRRIESEAYKRPARETTDQNDNSLQLRCEDHFSLWFSTGEVSQSRHRLVGELADPGGNERYRDLRQLHVTLAYRWQKNILVCVSDDDGESIRPSPFPASAVEL